MNLVNYSKFLKLSAIVLYFTFFTLGCSSDSQHGLSKSNPTEINVWTYYGGAVGIEFDELVAEFNSSVGNSLGIVVYSKNLESADALEQKLYDSSIGKIASDDIPDIFQCYPDYAVKLSESFELVNLDDYVSDDEKSSYVKSFLDSGCIGDDNEWKIFPVTKSTEILILNKTDWEMFSADTGYTTDDLATWEGLLLVAADYYEWSGGEAFLGFDSIANYLLTSSVAYGTDIFNVYNGNVTVNFDKDIMNSLWDYFYVPYINGYYRHDRQYSTESLKYGEVIAAVTSNASVPYLPSEIMHSSGKHIGTGHDAEFIVLSLPTFDRLVPCSIQQGAGMSVAKSDETHEYASVVFLKWLTQKEQNMRLCAVSGYMPVTVEAINPDYINEYFDTNEVDAVIRDSILTAVYQNQHYIMYSTPGFAGSVDVWELLDNSLLETAINDKASVDNGIPTANFLTTENFNDWYTKTYSELSKLCRQ